MNLKKINKLLFITLLVTSCSTSSKYNISAKINGVPDGNLVYLRNNEGNIDSATFKNQKVNFTGKTKYPDLYTLLIVDQNKKNPNFFPVIPFFLSNNKGTIEANLDSLPRLYDLRNNAVNYNKFQVEGLNLHNDFKDFQQGLQPLTQLRKASFRKYLDHLNYGKPYEEIHKGISLVKSVDSVTNIKDTYIKNFILSNPDSYISLYALSDQFQAYSATDLDQILNTLSPKLMNSEAGQKVKTSIEDAKKSAIGASLSEVMMQDTAGNAIPLSQLVEKGKYTLLEFWASWCAPCRFDIPHLKHVYELYNKAGFNIVSISMDHRKDDWLKAVNDEKMSWIQVSELKGFKGDVSKFYNFSGIPTAILIDPNGNIVTRNMRGSWMDGKLIEIFGDKF